MNVLRLMMVMALGLTTLYGMSAPTQKPKDQDKFQQITDSASVAKGFINIYHKGDDYYFEIPTEISHRDLLVVNRVLKVPYELNDAGINKGINYENLLVRFEIDKDAKKVFIRNVRPQPDAPSDDFIALSIQENFMSPLMASLNIEAFKADSSSVMVKVNDLYKGTTPIFNNVYKSINIGGSINKDLSRISRVKGFDNNIAVVSELSTKVSEGAESVFITVETVSSLVLLPEKPMPGRFLSSRVGYFTVPYTFYADKQSTVEQKEIITRWRLEPKDEAAYLRGELVEPKKPIVFYLDKSTPKQWRKYMKKGIEDWQIAFEKAGFKNAIIAKEFTDDMDQDDLNFSSITYVASEKMNAMGPSVYDPRSGEIIQADIIWWHNVVSMLREWIIVQTAASRPESIGWNLPEELLGDAMRFVACHEVGHSLGLRHNMIASAAFPTDSLRNNDFVKRWGTSTSIMDYSRYNYIAQPGDGVTAYSPQIGVYDLFAIEYGYRWSGKAKASDETAFLNDILMRHNNPIYRFMEAQDSRSAIDPRAQTEDLGNDPIKSSTYGINNLKRLMPRMLEMTRNGNTQQDFTEAGQLYYAIISYWNNLVYHPLANIGGIYLENNDRQSNRDTYTFVPKAIQAEATDFMIRETLIETDWLFNDQLLRHTFPLKRSPNGFIEQDPTLLLKNAQSYVYWDMLDDKRLIRMSINEYMNGKNTFTPIDLMDKIYDAVFKVSEGSRSLSMKERFVQKGLVDALIQATSNRATAKDGKTLTDWQLQEEDNALSGVIRNINFNGSLADRISDAISVKRGLLLRIQKTLERAQRRTSDRATQYHYQDMLMRIDAAIK